MAVFPRTSTDRAARTVPGRTRRNGMTERLKGCPFRTVLPALEVPEGSVRAGPRTHAATLRLRAADSRLPTLTRGEAPVAAARYPARGNGASRCARPQPEQVVPVLPALPL